MTPAPRNPPAGALPIDLDEVWQLAATARDLAWGLRECAEQLEGERDPRWVDFTRAVGTAIDRLAGDVCALVNEAEVAHRAGPAASPAAALPGQAGSDQLAPARPSTDDDALRTFLDIQCQTRLAGGQVLVGRAVSTIRRGAVIHGRAGGERLLGIVILPAPVNPANSEVVIQTQGICRAWIAAPVKRGELLTVDDEGGLVPAAPAAGKHAYCIALALVDSPPGRFASVQVRASTVVG
jgi:hypothetical protein